jgi:hypothetical protein
VTLANATEVVLGRRRARRTAPRPRTASAAIGRLASAGAGLKGVVTAAAGGTRRLDAVEARSVALSGSRCWRSRPAITVFPVFCLARLVIIPGLDGESGSSPACARPRAREDARLARAVAREKGRRRAQPLRKAG